MQSTPCPNHNIPLTALVRRQIRVYEPEYGGDKFPEQLVFGPNYRLRDIEEFWMSSKVEAVEHVLNNSGSSYSELMDKIRSIEEEARAAYVDNVVKNMTTLDFLQMMARDGCLFLLLAFCILGAGMHLRFPERHLLYGTGYAEEEETKWLRSMFVVGNQVPFVVLAKLMESIFFQEVKEKMKGKKQLGLLKRTLYKFLMVGQEPHPVDLIHCLQSIILGTTSDSVGATTETVGEAIPSASKLSERGVQFEKLEEEQGSRSIFYESSMFNAVLYLPVFSFDDDEHTELMVECLRKYEIVQEPRGMEREASSYFKLLRELILTTQDLEILSSCGVFQGEPESLRRLLRKFDCKGTSAHLCQVRKQIKEDRPLKWRKFTNQILKFIRIISSCLLLLFTYLQAHYTILGYYQTGN